MLAYSAAAPREVLRTRPALDRNATIEFANTLFPKAGLAVIGDGDLSFTSPEGNEVHAGCFPGVSVIAAGEFGIDHPSKLPAAYLEAGGSGMTHLHAMNSVVDWFAFAIWNDGKLQRSLSLSPDSGIIEDIGARLPFEGPYWDGKHPVSDSPEDSADYPFPFHPLDFGEAALIELFGYRIEGRQAADIPDPENIPLIRFRRPQKWWKLW